MSVNTFGVMKISTTTMTNAFAVPFGGFSSAGDAPNTLSNLLQKTAVDLNTKAYIWNPGTKVYDVYKYDGTVWQPQTVLQVEDEDSGVSAGAGASEAEKQVATGTGFFLEFTNSTPRTVYLFGQALTNNYDTVTVAAGTTALIAPASTNCGSIVSLKGIAGTCSSVNNYGVIQSMGDSIQMLGGGRIYYRIGDVWKFKPMRSDEEFVDYKTWVAPEYLNLQPGCAFWYTNRGKAPITITLTPTPPTP